MGGSPTSHDQQQPVPILVEHEARNTLQYEGLQRVPA